MTEEELQENIVAIRRASAEIRTPEDARQKLIEDGFITEDGELTPDYRQAQ